MILNFTSNRQKLQEIFFNYAKTYGRPAGTRPLRRKSPSPAAPLRFAKWIQTEDIIPAKCRYRLWRWYAIDRQKYIAELNKLLGFMSAWDRKAALRRFERMFDRAEDEEALIESLGTPTKVAVELARDYEASPPPEDTGEWDLPAGTRGPVLLPADAAEPARVRRELSPGGIFGFILFALFVGLPVAALLICLGLPFMAVGAVAIGASFVTISETLGIFHLWSDFFMVAGVGLVVSAVALVVFWFGLWLSISLCRMWFVRVLGSVASRLCFREE